MHPIFEPLLKLILFSTCHANTNLKHVSLLVRYTPLTVYEISPSNLENP
jgi:hypothetical protein